MSAVLSGWKLNSYLMTCTFCSGERLALCPQGSKAKLESGKANLTQQYFFLIYVYDELRYKRKYLNHN